MGLDLPVRRLAQILERCEANDRVAAVEQFVGSLDWSRPVNEVPAGEVDVAEQVIPPCRLHRRLVGEDEYAFPAHLLR